MAHQHFTPDQLTRLVDSMKMWLDSHPTPDTPAFSLGWKDFATPRQIVDGVGQAIKAREGALSGPLAPMGEDMIEMLEACLGSLSPEDIIHRWSTPRRLVEPEKGGPTL